MYYKTILAHADVSPAAGDRARLAVALARAFDAHLVVTSLTGISRLIPSQVMANGGPALAACCAALRRDADAALTSFVAAVREQGFDGCEARLVDDDVGAGLALQARYADLVIAGQATPGTATPPVPGDLVASLLLRGGRPVLVAPHAGCSPSLQGTALIGWDGSVAALRAIVGALPLLRLMRHATVVAIDDGGPCPRMAEDPCVAMAGYLRRHGIDVHIGRRSGPHRVADTLLDEATRRHAGLLVIGGYGHAHVREVLLGGVTETVLRTASLPVLLAH